MARPLWERKAAGLLLKGGSHRSSSRVTEPLEEGKKETASVPSFTVKQQTSIRHCIPPRENAVTDVVFVLQRDGKATLPVWTGENRFHPSV